MRNHCLSGKRERKEHSVGELTTKDLNNQNNTFRRTNNQGGKWTYDEWGGGDFRVYQLISVTQMIGIKLQTYATTACLYSLSALAGPPVHLQGEQPLHPSSFSLKKNVQFPQEFYMRSAFMTKQSGKWLQSDLQLKEGSNRLAIDFLVSFKDTKRELPGPRIK